MHILLSQDYFLKDCSFFIEFSWYVCLKPFDYKCDSLFLAVSSIPLICTFIPMPVPHCLDYFVTSFIMKACWILSNNCYASIEMIVLFLHLILLIWILNQLCNSHLFLTKTMKKLEKPGCRLLLLLRVLLLN